MTHYDRMEEAPQRHYGVIYADPSWHHVSYSTKGQSRSPSSHYKTMSLDAIRALPVGGLAAKDCHLMMWTTQPHLEQSFSIMRAWGFRYSSVFNVWLKLNPKAADQMFLTMRDFHKGMGFTTRKNFELLLLGRKGSPKRLRKDIPDFLITALRRHSQKPDEMIKRIESYASGPFIELNSRTERDGWDSWGDQPNILPAGKGGGSNRSHLKKPVIVPAASMEEVERDLAIPSFLRRLTK